MANPDPDLYLVRVWRDGAFRATARRVDEEAQHCLHSPEALAAYLAGDTASPLGAALPPQHQADPPAAVERENTP